MIYRKHLLIIFIIISILIINLFVPYGGYVLVGGDSMYPAIDEGCGIIGAESWDGKSSLEGEIVAFQIDNEEPAVDSFIVNNTISWFAHRVVSEEKNYDMNNSNYYIEQINEDYSVLVYKIEDKYIHHIPTDQDVEELYNLEGEHTFIAKGDNRINLDSEIIPADNVKGIINNDKYYKLQSLDTWPCSILD